MFGILNMIMNISDPLKHQIIIHVYLYILCRHVT